jgi:hypothetical protein
MSTLRDLTGQRFGRLTVLRRDRGMRQNRNARWVCLCDCGAFASVMGFNLISCNTKSCGCLRREIAKELMDRHRRALGA